MVTGLSLLHASHLSTYAAILPKSIKQGQVSSECCDLTENPDFDPGYLRYLDNPGFLTVCYCLALMHQLGQLGGLDFLSTLGMVLAMISMMSMLFI